MEKIFLEMDDSENKIKDIRPLTQDDDLLLLKIAQKYNHNFEVGSPLDNFSKNFSLQKIV
jgi:hypothetical protein